MAKEIWKYPLKPTAVEQLVDMRRGSRVVHVGEQYGFVCVWAETDREQPVVTRMFQVVSTGQIITGRSRSRKAGGTWSKPQPFKYQGTAMCPPYVWHVYMAEGES